MVTTRSTKRAPAAKERLSREAIVTSALALADAEGLDAVTIRRLATDHGVTPMALYWHFADKERLLDGIAGRLLAGVAIPAREEARGTWDEQFHELLSALLEQLRAHPAAAPLVQTRIFASEQGLELTDRALGLLRGAGFSIAQASQIAHHALCSMVVLVASEPGLQIGADREEHEQRMRTKRAVLQALPPGRYPNVVASADLLTGCADSPEYFTLGLELFVAGVRSIQPAEATQPAEAARPAQG